MTDEDDRKLHDFLVRYSAKRHLNLYLRERHGLLIWKAFAEYRQHGLPVPENILAKFDEWAAALRSAKTEKQVAAAIEMSTIKRRPASTRLQEAERNRDVMEDLNIRTHDLRQQAGVAARAVAQDFGLQAGNVKTIKSRWHKAKTIEPVNDAAASADDTAAPDPTLQTVWLQRSPK